MGTATVLADAIDALVDLLKPMESTDPLLRVIDGPWSMDRSAEVEIWVGATGVEDDDTGATLERVRTHLGGGSSASRDEVVTIPCAIWVIGGSAEMRARRRRAVQVFDSVSARIAESGQLGLPGALCGWADVTSGTLRQIQSPDGASVVLSIAVRLKVRI